MLIISYSTGWCYNSIILFCHSYLFAYIIWGDILIIYYTALLLTDAADTGVIKTPIDINTVIQKTVVKNHTLFNCIPTFIYYLNNNNII